MLLRNFCNWKASNHKQFNETLLLIEWNDCEIEGEFRWM